MLETVRGAVRRLQKISNGAFECDDDDDDDDDNDDDDDDDYHYTGAMCGVMVSMSPIFTSACHQCKSTGSSLGWGLNFRALACGIFSWSSSGFFSGHSGLLPAFIGEWVQPTK